MTWDDIRAIAFGRLHYKPVEFYELDYEELLLLLKGWNDEQRFVQMIHRNSAAIISDVFNQTMGGKGAMSAVYQMWPLTEEEMKKNSGSQMSKDDLKHILREHERLVNLKRKNGGTDENTNRG